MRRHLAALAGLLLALTACADADEPRSTREGDGTVAEPEVVAAHADDVLVSIHMTGYEGDPGPDVPDYEVRTDGTVFLSGGTGFGVETLTLGEDEVDEVREAFEEVSLRQADYDESWTTDLPWTTVYSTVGGRPEQVRVYGFEHDDEVDDEDWERLEAALAVLRDVTDTGRTPYTPEEVAVLLTPAAETGGGDWPLAEPLHRTRQWWGPRGTACVIATGADVAALAPLREDGDDAEQSWTTAAPASSALPAAVDADVRPLLPGTRGPCTEAPPAQLSVGAFYSVAPGDPAAWKGLGPADRWRVPTPLEIHAVVDEVEAAVTEATGEAYPDGQLHSYDTSWVTGSDGGRTYVEVVGDYPEKYRDDQPDVPTTWQVRVDLVSGAVAAVEVEGVS